MKQPLQGKDAPLDWRISAGRALTGFFWLGVFWLVVSSVCIAVAEIWMSDDQYGNYGRLVFYRVWGPSALMGACLAGLCFEVKRRLNVARIREDRS